MPYSSSGLDGTAALSYLRLTACSASARVAIPERTKPLKRVASLTFTGRRESAGFPSRYQNADFFPTAGDRLRPSTNKVVFCRQRPRLQATVGGDRSGTSSFGTSCSSRYQQAPQDRVASTGSMCI